MPSGTIIIAAEGGLFPWPIVAAVIEIKKTWTAMQWEVHPELRIRSLSVKMAGAGIGACEFERPYGTVHHPYNVSATAPFKDETPVDYTGWWFRVKFISEGARNPVVVFVGQVAGEARAVKGGKQTNAQGSAEVASGAQIWTAYEPMWILQKMAVNTSWWRVPSGEHEDPDDPDAMITEYETREMGWVPDINLGGGSGELIGNRCKDIVSDPDYDSSYLYSPPERLDLETPVHSSLWSMLDYLEYLLARHATTLDGPTWKINRVEAEKVLGGGVYIPRTNTIKLSQSETVASILRKIFDPMYGVDFDVLPFYAGDDTTQTTLGFEVRPIPIVAEEETFTAKDHRGVTYEGHIPANPYAIEMKVSDAVEYEDVTVIENIDQKFSEIVVQGERILSCCTIEAKTDAEVAEDHVRSIVPLWTDELEEEYLKATDDAAQDWENQDRARRQERFAAVFQAFGVPLYWNWNDGLASPALDANGQLITEKPSDWEEGDTDPRIGEYQSGTLKTEAFIPLFEHVNYATMSVTEMPDYSQVPPGVIPQLMQPQAWVWDIAADGTRGDVWRRINLRELEEGGVSIQPLKNTLGLFLRCTPQHLLALGHWSDGFSWGDGKAPAYNHEHLIFTVALRTNQRFAMRWKVPEKSEGGPIPLDEDESKKVIQVPGAEFWVVAPNTVYGLDGTGKTKVVGGSDDVRWYPGGTEHKIDSEFTSWVARNDSGRMVAVMAGAIARYKATRAKASITMRGLQPWRDLIGTVLTTVEKGGRLRRVDAIVTSVAWNVESNNQKTTIKAGYA